MGFSMVEMGENRFDILSGKKPIGRVCQHADGTWIGLVGKYIIVRGMHSAKGAFNEAVAKHLRYDNPHKGKRKKKTMTVTSAVTEALQNSYSTIVPYVFRATSAQMRPMERAK